MGSVWGLGEEIGESLEATASDDPAHAVERVVRGTDPNLERQRGRLLFAGDPFSGVVERFDSDGTLRSRERYLAGLRHGMNERWYASGVRESRRRYERNRKHGRHDAWFENGQRKFLMFFDQGKYQGERKEWYPSGDVYAIFQYVNGEEVGLQRVWGPNGKLRSNYFVKDGRRYGLIGAKPCVSVPTLAESELSVVTPGADRSKNVVVAETEDLR